MTKTVVSIPGIHCNGCANLIKDVTGDFPAVRAIDVAVDSKVVTLEHDDSFDFEAWKREIEAANPKYAVLPIA